MAEQQPPDNAADPVSPQTNITAAPRPIAELFLDHGVSDEAPTIISKAPPLQARPEALFNPGLRGRKLAHFELIEPIGVGGMAAVIRARDSQLDRVVALKILPPEMAGDPENVRRFHQEARAAAKLDHENIARVFYYGEDQRLHFIAFEFVEGDNLRTVLERRGRLAVSEAVNYVLQIAMGLAHAAARGVVHRDIKPSNIIITPTGRAKLVDMGLARHLGPHDAGALTQSGVTLGTFDYISPEQALEPRDADVRSDIYSLGCTFYHVLTGQPPVPEGTAAKKLHHHQNLAPLDPRQLNPAVPDDVAAVLARMMAKDPRDRYQRAEHLVLHLIQVAQKVGAPAEVPESLLFVDAPLPTAPRHRPVMLTAVALVALAALLLALSLSPSGRDEPHRPGWADARPTQPVVRDAPRDKTPAPQVEQPAPQRQATKRVSSFKELADALEDRDVRKILLEDDIDLSQEKGLRWHGAGRLRIESVDPRRPRTLTVAYHPAMAGNPFWAGLTVAGGEATVAHVRFLIRVRAAETPRVLLAGLALQDGGKLTLTGCVFDQDIPRSLEVAEGRAAARVASVYVEGAGEAADRPTLVLDRCDLVRGQDAILVTGNARVEPSDCTFGPHAAHLHLRGRGAPWQTAARLKNCSLFVVNGPMLRLDDDATCELTAQQTIFSGEPGAAAAAETHLFWQTAAAAAPAVRYHGKHNAFYKINSYWVRAAERGDDPRQITDWREFRKEVLDARGADDGSRVLDKNPWQAGRPPDADTPQKDRYRLAPPVVAAWFQETGGVLGARTLAGGEDLYDPADLRLLASPAAPVVAREPNQKIVDPTARLSEGVYPSLAEAVQGAKSGDVILLKQNGKVGVEPVVTKADLSLTIKPYPGCHPVLTLAESAVDEDAALFRLSHGQLQFEDLEFLLRPDRDGYTSQTVVALAGFGRCLFKQCVVTLDPAARDVRLSAVTLLDSKGVMKMPTKTEGRTAPEVVVRTCLVRGQGSLLAGRACRPYDLDVSNSLVVLEGSLLDADGSPREMTAERGAQIRLARVTTYLTENLLHLYGSKSGKGFLTLRVEPATDCLFASPQGKPLVHLESLDSEEQMRRAFAWKGTNNAYSGFDKMLEMQPGDGEVVMRRFDPEAWQKFANVADNDPRFLKQKLDFSAMEERPLTQTLPDDFRLAAVVRQELGGVGAPLDELPRPWGVKETERPSAADAD
jgi:serine/threonine protein kinase